MSYTDFMYGLMVTLFCVVLLLLAAHVILQIRFERDKLRRAKEGIIVFNRPTKPNPRFAEAYDKFPSSRPSQGVYDQEEDKLDQTVEERSRIVALKDLNDSKARVYSQVSEDRKKPFKKETD